MFLRAYFDEAGTDQNHDHAVAAGAIALDHNWDIIEDRWNEILARSSYKLSYFHAQDFNSGKKEFKNWSRLKRDRFSKAINKILQLPNLMYVSAAVDKAVHKDVKQRIQKLRFKGAKVDSDFGMCFRAILSDCLQKFADIDPDTKIKIIVEDGPYSKDVLAIYESLKNNWTSKYEVMANMLNGFTSAPKGSMRGLEVADFLADKAIKGVENNTFLNLHWQNQMARIVNKESLEAIYDAIFNEKERRKAYWGNTSPDPASEE